MLGICGFTVLHSIFLMEKGGGKPLEFLLKVPVQFAGQELFFQPKKGGATDVSCAEAGKVGSVDLGVNELAATVAEGLHKERKGRLGAVWLAGEHGFPEEHLSHQHTVESARQLSVLPHLHGMGYATVKEVAVGFNHGGANPCSVLIWPPDAGTGFNHLMKLHVHCVAVGRVAEEALESAGKMEFLGEQHKAGVGRPPHYWLPLVLVKPGEDSLQIGRIEHVPGDGVRYRHDSLVRFIWGGKDDGLKQILVGRFLHALNDTGLPQDVQGGNLKKDGLPLEEEG